MAQSVSQTILHCNHAKNTKHLSAPFQDILVIPVYHCGDGTCESSLGESPANCCYDCACKDSPSYGTGYYCDFDPDTHLGGCLPKANISLVIDSPTAPVYFSTCEMTNTVNIKAHIENQPKNAKPGHEYATLNGSAAEMLHCDEEQSLEGGYDGGGNYTFNCTLMVPRLSQCSEGRTYTYEPNSLSFLISYKNGNQKTEAQTLTASLPTITTRQGIRTMYDITQEGIRKMKASLQKTMDITREMLDAFKSCMETVKAIAYMTMIAAIAGGIYSTATAKTGTMSGNLKEGVNTAVGIGQFGTKISEAYSKMCEYLQTQYRMDLEVQKIETEMVKMEMCMEQNQHMLDVGQCDKNPQNCFTQMTSCVDFNNIDKYTDRLGDIIKDGNDALGEMTDAIDDAADALEDIGGGSGTAIFAVYCNSDAGNSCCNKYVKSTTKTGDNQQYVCGYSEIRLAIEKIDCKYPVVYKDGSQLCTTDCNNYKFDLKSVTSAYKSAFKLYCFDDASEYNSARTSGKMGSYEVTGEGKSMDIEVDTNGNCDCTDESGSTSAALTITDVNVPSITSNSATFTWKTNKLASSIVVCADRDGGTYYNISENPVKDHEQTLTGLESGMEYFCIVQSNAGSEKKMYPEETKLKINTPTSGTGNGYTLEKSVFGMEGIIATSYVPSQHDNIQCKTWICCSSNLCATSLGTGNNQLLVDAVKACQTYGATGVKCIKQDGSVITVDDIYAV